MQLLFMGCKSIAFPLLAAGNNGYDVDLAFQIAGRSIEEYQPENTLGDYVYFGRNKMITRLDINTGELKYYTNKNDEEMAALASMW